MARGVDAKSMYSFNAIGNRRRQKGKNPSLKAREGWKWKAEPSRFVYHRYEFFSLRPSFFSLYQHDILISLKLREKFISPPPGTSETPSGKNRQKSRATYYEQACCSLKISGSLTFHHQRTGSFVRKQDILISFHLRFCFIPSDF